MDGQFRSKYTDALAVQDAIGERLTRELTLVLNKQEREQLNKRPTSNPEAYEAYLKGRYFWNKRMPEETRKSITYFKQAIERDPNFAVAYAGPADAYLIDNAVEAESTLRRAMELDWTLGEAHASLGFNRMFWHCDWEGAEQELKLAIELDPLSPNIHADMGQINYFARDYDDAIAECRKALGMDPDFLLAHRNLFYAYAKKPCTTKPWKSI